MSTVGSRLLYLRDIGLLETLSIELGEPKLYWCKTFDNVFLYSTNSKQEPPFGPYIPVDMT